MLPTFGAGGAEEDDGIVADVNTIFIGFNLSRKMVADVFNLISLFYR